MAKGEKFIGWGVWVTLIIYSSPLLRDGPWGRIFAHPLNLTVIADAIGKTSVIGLCSALNQAETLGDTLQLRGHSLAISPPAESAAWPGTSPQGEEQRQETLPMNGIRTTAYCAVVAIAALFAAAPAWGGGEVTVVGVAWQSPRTLDPIQDNAAQPISASSVAQSPTLLSPTAEPIATPPPQTPAQPMLDDDGSEFHEELCDFERWLDGFGLGGWSIDYRYRALVSSGVTSTFGTSAPPPTGYAPLSQLNFPLNSSWHGIRIERDQPTWGVHFEWMAPQQSINGQLTDCDWQFSGPPGPDQQFTDLGFAQERFVDGQMIDLGLDFQLCDHVCRFPIEVWPTIGFRWQRFDITAYDGTQVKFYNQWLDPPDQYPGDVITFNQQFYMGYLGGQFRMRLRSVLLTFQADWGYTWGYNTDHHLVRAGDLFTMEATEGNTWHLGFTAEVPLGCHVSLGFQCDHMEIRTSGTHRLQNLPLGEDYSWDNGVSVSSNQTSLMAFLRFRL